jgi:hypothetical protein
MDGEEVLALVEAIDRAHVHAVRVLALDAGFGDDVGHVWDLPDPGPHGPGERR